MDTLEIKRDSQRILSSIKPEKLLRQNTYAVLAFLLMTSLLIYFYSYPLEISGKNARFLTNDLTQELNSKPVGKVLFYEASTERVTVPTSTSKSKASTPDNISKSHESSNKPSSEEASRTDEDSNSESMRELMIIINRTTSKLKPATQTVNASESRINFKDVQDSFRVSNIIDETVTNENEARILKETQNLSIRENEATQQAKQTTINSTQVPSEQRSTTEFKKSSGSTSLHLNSTNEKPSANNTKETELVSSQNTTSFDQTVIEKIKEIKPTSFQPDNVTESNLFTDLTQSTKSEEVKFLVNTKDCKIPDIDPMHPNILQFVKFTDPLICKNKDPLTRTDGNILFIDEEAITNQTISKDKLSCCYKPLYRAKEGSSDNKISFGHCHEFTDKSIIRDEFIKVQCTYKNKPFYEDYHSFIHDKTHVEERCNKHNNSKYSVLIIGIDSMSRMNMHRQMNKTMKYLLDKMGATEMYGFNKVGDNTFPNIIPLLTGYDERELPRVCFNQSNRESLDKCNFLWKSYANNGYRTLYAEDTPTISTFNYVKKGFFYQPTDYYIRHFMLAYEKALGHSKTANCYACLGSVSATETILHWAEQFASHFKTRSYFAFNWINSLTHDYMNLASSGDHMYEQFFRKLHQSGALDRTIVVVMGDHGMRWGPIRETYIGRLEERLPILVIALPDEFKKEFPKETEALKVNSHRLVTPFDLHSTLANLPHLKEQHWEFTNSDNVSSELANNFTKRARSLFKIVSENRSCDDAFIEEHWCTCESSLPMDTDDDYVKIAAKFLVKTLNNLLKPMHGKCAKLKLTKISDARVWSPSSEHIGHTKNDHILTVIVKTSPGKAMFEGTVRISLLDENCELLGTVSRLNLYGNQSACIQNAALRKYCYCL